MDTSTQQARPNILLITTDQQRFDALAANGSAFLHTPALDALAAGGARFTRAYCTNPVCTPSRVSIFTGQFPSNHGSYNIGTQPTSTGRFLSTRLRDAGYRTHHIGKAHFYPWDVPSPENRSPQAYDMPWLDFAGFDTAELVTGHTLWGVTGHYERWLNSHGIFKGQNMPELQVQQRLQNDPYDTGDWPLPTALHFGNWAAERAESFLAGHSTAQPFFLNIGLQDPHHPHVLPFDFTGRVKPEDIPAPQAGFDRSLEHLQTLEQGEIETSRFAGPHRIAGNTNADWAAYAADTDKARATAAYYYSMVQLLDTQVGRILDALERGGLAQNTIVVFTSDHGDMLFHHGLGQKGPVAFEDVLRVPLLLRYPEKVAPRVVEQVVSLADIYPTLLGYAGVPAENCGGASLVPLLEGGPLPREGVRVEFTEDAGAISYRCWITQDTKLVEYPGESFGELYCLRDDPGEQVNLYNDPAHYPTRLHMLNALLEDIIRTETRNERPCRC